MKENNSKAVEVSGLEKKFGNFTAVNRIDFSVNRGEIFGFLGPNGAGKSTTIRMLCGILSPTSGTGHVGEFDITRQQEQIKQNIGYMSQRFSLYEDLTVEENINFYSGIYKIPRFKKQERKEWIIQMAGLQDIRHKLTGTLSGGWKQRLALGCTLIHEPRIIFLDEPTSGVDPIARRNFWTMIKKMAGNGITVFVTTHYMDEAENCDRIALIYKGSIVASGSPAELKTGFMQKEVLAITVAQPEEWLEQLANLKTVKEVALFGTDLHAIVENAAAAEKLIKELFSETGAGHYTITKITPSLEDVFVSLIMAYDAGKGNGEL